MIYGFLKKRVCEKRPFWAPDSRLYHLWFLGGFPRGEDTVPDFPEHLSGYRSRCRPVSIRGAMCSVEIHGSIS